MTTRTLVVQNLRKSSRLWDEIGDGYRARALKRGAATIAGLDDAQWAGCIKNKTLARLPGVGKGIVERIEEIIETGELQELEGLEAEAEFWRNKERREAPTDPQKAEDEDYQHPDPYACPF